MTIYAIFVLRYLAPTCREFGDKISMWTTFNEAAVMGFCGWLYGAFPPAKMIQFYTAIKALPGGPHVAPRVKGFLSSSRHSPVPSKKRGVGVQT
jgi:hypothetical protein